MSSSVGAEQKDKLEELQEDAKKGEWSKVIEAYKQESVLCTVEITETGDTFLHMAVSNGRHDVVEQIVDLIVKAKTPKAQNNNEVQVKVVGEENEKSSNVNATCILGAKNKKGNTPLHLAVYASQGSLEMCKKIGGVDASLIAIRNNVGETPIFMAAFHGNREAFLCLHDLYTKNYHGSSTCDAYYKNGDDDSILYCAIARGHIDLAIDIVLLYKDDYLKEMTLKRNKNGLSPLHLLAATPSTFESIDLLDRSFVVQLLYHWCFRVEKKKQATKMEELNQRRERKSYVEGLLAAFIDKWVDTFSEGDYSCIWNLIVALVGAFILLSLLVPPLIFEQLILSAGNWFHGIRKMKEKHTWSLQIMEELLRHVSPEDMSANSYEVDSEAGSLIVDTPLMIAAKNGVIEMVDNILRKFPSTMEVVNEEGKNIVLLAAEKRQTKLYQTLRGNEYLDKSIFRKVDKDGNTALHLAAKLGLNLNLQTTTMVEEFKWFELVKNSVPYELWEIYNKEGKTAEEIFRESYKEHMASDRQWLNQTSQTCSVASTLVASMAFSNFAGENINKKNNPSLVALSLSLTSTISFLAILAFRSQSLNFWRYVPFMLHIAILTMFGSIVALWISLMVHGHSLTTYAILGSPIAILTIVSLPIFIGPTLMSTFTKVPPPNRNITNAIQYRRPKKKENATDLNL